MGDWIRAHLIALLSLIVGVLALGATVLQVPDFRWRVLHDAKYEPQFISPDRAVVEEAPAPAPSLPHPLVTMPPASHPAPSLVEIRSSSAAASSILPPSRVASYGPEMATDGHWSTVWVEGANGDGSGEWIELQLQTPFAVSRVGIVNGYGKGERFSENERVRDALITFSDGTSQRIHLADHNDLQYFDVGAHTTTSLRLTILSVYRGTRWDDAAIGEIRLWGPARASG